ncbi:MAG: hypothetical protein ABI612_12825 [Betaproteobacteria bacterium]
MRLAWAVAAAVVLVLSGCSLSKLSQQKAAPLAYRAFGGDTLFYWVESPSNSISTVLAGAALSSQVPIVQGLTRIVRSASSQPIRVSVSGTDSVFTANVIGVALGSITNDLPGLQLAFIGNTGQEASVRHSVEAKRGTFAFVEQP